VASVKKRSGSKFWTVCYRLPNGQRVQRSSGLTDKTEAQILAHKLEGCGQRYDRARALKLVDEIAAAAGEHLLDPTPVAAYMESYLSAKSATWSASTRRNNRSYVSDYCREYPNHLLGHVTAADIAAYRDRLLARGRSPKTVTNHLRFLRAVFASAVEAGRIEVNPAKQVKMPKAGKSIKRAFSFQQFRSLLNATRGEWHLLILIGGLTGQRLRDCLGLQYEQIGDDCCNEAKGLKKLP